MPRVVDGLEHAECPNFSPLADLRARALAATAVVARRASGVGRWATTTTTTRSFDRGW
jgi:hypothetical protein